MGIERKSENGLNKPNVNNPKDTHGLLIDGINEFVRLNRTYDFTDGAGNDEPFSLYFRGSLLSLSSTAFFISKLARFGTDPNNAFALLTLTTGEIRLLLSESLTASGTMTATTVNTLSLNTTYNIVATYDGNKTVNSFHIYVDAVDQTLNVVDNSYSGMPLSSLNITVGAKGFNYAPYMHGVISESAIYNRVLTQDEVTKIHNGADPSNYEGCIHYAKLGDFSEYADPVTGSWVGRDLSRFSTADWNSQNLEETDKIIL